MWVYSYDSDSELSTLLNRCRRQSRKKAGGWELVNVTFHPKQAVPVSVETDNIDGEWVAIMKRERDDAVGGNN